MSLLIKWLFGTTTKQIIQSFQYVALILDDELAEALKKLPERKRNTLLMYYFLEMTESEIANLQKITQSGVFRNRHHALETMKKILKEEH